MTIINEDEFLKIDFYDELQEVYIDKFSVGVYISYEDMDKIFCAYLGHKADLRRAADAAIVKSLGLRRFAQ